MLRSALVEHRRHAEVFHCAGAERGLLKLDEVRTHGAVRLIELALVVESAGVVHQLVEDARLEPALQLSGDFLFGGVLAGELPSRNGSENVPLFLQVQRLELFAAPEVARILLIKRGLRHLARSA